MSTQPSYQPQLPRTFQALALDGREYRWEFVYRERVRSWYLSLLDQGTYLTRSARVAPGMDLILRLGWDELPPGAIVATGPDPYTRAALGDPVRVPYLTEVENAVPVQERAFSIRLLP